MSKQLEFDFREEGCCDEIVIKMNVAMAEDLLSGIKKMRITQKMNELESEAVALLVSSLTQSLKED